MDLSDKLAALAQRVGKLKESVETEEATKNAFIMPFLSALGYDVFDPQIVVPEYTADVGVKKGEKVDYAIKLEGKLSILIECKPCKTELAETHTSQLFRYFSTTEARFAILTNGLSYWFFTDLELTNKMDSKPFFIFNILDYRTAQVEELKKFGISNFNVDTILETASDLKYGSLLMREIANEIENPSNEFMRLIIGRVYDGKLTANVLTKFSALTQKAMKDTVRELLNRRLTSALDGSASHALPSGAPEVISANPDSMESVAELDEIVTTQEELEGFQIVRAIVRERVKVDRIYMRDAKSYCAILLDNNNRRPICRLHLDRGTKYISLFDKDRNGERLKIESLDDIFLYAARLKATVEQYAMVKGDVPLQSGNDLVDQSIAPGAEP